MTQREAKRAICGVLADTLLNDLSQMAEYLYIDARGEVISEDDQKRLLKAANELLMELLRRSEKEKAR